MSAQELREDLDEARIALRKVICYAEGLGRRVAALEAGARQSASAFERVPLSDATPDEIALFRGVSRRVAERELNVKRWLDWRGQPATPREVRHGLLAAGVACTQDAAFANMAPHWRRYARRVGQPDPGQPGLYRACKIQEKR